MKTISVVFIALCATVAVSAQSFKDHFFSSIGFSPFLDFGASPAQVEGPYADANNNGNPVYILYQAKWSFAPCFAYEARYNLTEPSENMAVSVKFTPTLSGMANEGILGLYFPIGLGLELGNGATYQTSANTGFSVTAGYSINMTPLIKAGDVNTDADTYGATLKSNWSCPYIAVGIRYWNKKNKLREISIRYGFGPSGDTKPTGATTSHSINDLSSSYNLRVTWMKYINY
jgi:hypothetical protein